MSSTGSREDLRREFPPSTTAQWRAEAERLLRGAPFDQTLRTRLPEGLTLEPIYDAAATVGVPALDTAPGRAPYLRGDVPRRPAWWIAQEQALERPELLSRKLRSELEQGLDAVVLDAFANAVGSGDAWPLEQILEGVDLSATPLLIHGGGSVEALRARLEPMLESGPDSSPRGILGADPLGEAARRGSTSTLETDFDELVSTLRWCREAAPKMRTIWLRGELFHEAGAHAVQELGMLLAVLVETLRALERRGVVPDEAAPHLAIGVGIGGRFFTELAKARALRMLVARVLESCGVQAEARHFHLHARCGARNKSCIDEHVNLLRSTTEAFAAAAGGADSIHIDPFDAPLGASDADSRRLARNVQLVLREEARLSRVVDPAGGSWYVERHTADLCEKAWELFCEIEARGGFLASLRDGEIQERLRSSRDEQSRRVATRREIRVGVNRYPAPVMRAGEPPRAREAANGNPEFESLPRYRECSPFEELRARVESSRDEDEGPWVFVADLGPPGRTMARLDFVGSSLRLGGFEVRSHTATGGIENLARAAGDSGAGAIVLCGTDDVYAERGREAVRELRKACPETQLLLAGMPDDPLRGELVAAGIDHFLHAGCDILALLTSLAQHEGVDA